MHEGGIRTPLVARWPGHVQPGSLTDQVGHIIDILPTLLDLADLPQADSVNGRQAMPLEGSSLREVLCGGRREPPAQLCWDFYGNAAIRQGDWKLVWDKTVGAWELYHLSNDPTELNDLVASYPDRVRQMAADYNRWAEETSNTPRPAQ